MFDINLINEPGVQNDDKKNHYVEPSQVKDDSVHLKKTDANKNKKAGKNKKQFSFFLFSIVLILLAVYIYNYNNLINLNQNREQAFLVDDIVNILDKNQSDINVSLIAFNRNQLLINFRICCPSLTSAPTLSKCI